MGFQGDSGKANGGLRTIFFLAVIVAGFSAVIARLFAVQIQRGDEFARRSRDNFVQTERLEHDRGEIMDRDGRLLVTNRASYDVVVTPAFLPSERRMVGKLGRVFGLDRKESAAIAVAFSRSAEEQGPPILLAREATALEISNLRRVQAQLEIPMEAIPVLRSQGVEGEDLFAAYLDPGSFPSVSGLFRRVAEIVGLSQDELTKLERRARRVYGLQRYRGLVVRHDVELAAAERLMMLIELGDLPGVTVRESKARDYRHDWLAAHLIGYVNELSTKELDRKRELGYRLGDRIGRAGIEQSFEEALRGVDGHRPVVVDSKGRAQTAGFARSLQEELGEGERPRAGNRVVLSIDLDIQRAAEGAFPGRAGAVVALEVDTGRILALTSTPTFNPNLLSGSDRTERRRLHKIRKLRPWRFRAIQDHYAPGSTFKVVTALAALEAKQTYHSEEIHCPGVYRLGDTRFRCWKDVGHGPVDLVTSLQKSCDVYYYTLGNRLGLDPIAAMAQSLGFGQRSGIDIRGEGKGIMPTEAWYKRRFGHYTRGAAVNASIGQGAVAVTPLQLAVAYAALANGGRVYKPQVALRVEAATGDAVRVFEPELVRTVAINEAHVARTRLGLQKVVNARGGTAYRYRLEDVMVSGKTGTAQVAKLGHKRKKTREMPWNVRDHAWFAAMAPAEDPEVVVVVLNEHGGHGGSGSAPTAMAVIKAWWLKQQVRAGASVPRLDVRAVGG